jgi:hypothetical protein
MISAAAALASGLLLTAMACEANVDDAPAGKRHPPGNCAASRAGSALVSVAGVVRWAQALSSANTSGNVRAFETVIIGGRESWSDVERRRVCATSAMRAEPDAQ